MNTNIIHDILEEYSHYILDEKSYTITKTSNNNSQRSLRELIAIVLELDEQSIKYEVDYNDNIQLKWKY